MLERADGASPDKLYEKRWALSLLEQVMQRLEKDCKGVGKELFDALKPTIWGEPTEIPYEQIANRLRMMEDAVVKVAAHRMRERYRELLRAAVADTVATSAEVNEELRYLAAVLRS